MKVYFQKNYSRKLKSKGEIQNKKTKEEWRKKYYDYFWFMPHVELHHPKTTAFPILFIFSLFRCNFCSFIPIPNMAPLFYLFSFFFLFFFTFSFYLENCVSFTPDINKCKHGLFRSLKVQIEKLGIYFATKPFCRADFPAVYDGNPFIRRIYQMTSKISSNQNHSMTRKSFRK